MKYKLLTILLLFTYSIYSQSSALNLGLHYNLGNEITKDYKSINFSTDLLLNGYLFGLEIGTGGSTNGEDYSNTINIDQFARDRIGTLSYTTYNVGLRLGKELRRNLYISGTLGFVALDEYQDRFDNYHILGDNGAYVVLQESNNNAYVRFGVSYKIKKVIPEISLGTTGFQFGCSFVLL